MSKEDDAIIQAVQGALFAANPDNEVGWDECGELAKAAIAAYLGSLEAAGWAVVRKDATIKQVYAAIKSPDQYDPAIATYRTMVAASPKPPGLGD
ncbi:hypothetical protein M5E06_13270 [Azospirillum sp. A1-3]|uniref:hypothetical protein n=1 Tax=Azospirillum sp. A1-3 TaxID=185874 RepID=UPI002077314D|nr:hypothetical protein [Azospirillum sp. A1-3]MCM8735153.1 hypothetical protein [Azospirillum sp. A1-3]